MFTWLLIKFSIAGTTASIITCPLEVVKTRLQSSGSTNKSSSETSSSTPSSSTASARKLPNVEIRNVPKLEASFVAQVRPSPSKSSPFFPQYNFYRQISTADANHSAKIFLRENGGGGGAKRVRLSLYRHFVHIIKTEGPLGLWRGVGPTLIGVAPSRFFCFLLCLLILPDLVKIKTVFVFRAIYFCAYSNTKAQLNETLVPDTPIVHFCSAFAAGMQKI